MWTVLGMAKGHTKESIETKGVQYSLDSCSVGTRVESLVVAKVDLVPVKFRERELFVFPIWSSSMNTQGKGTPPVEQPYLEKSAQVKVHLKSTATKSRVPSRRSRRA